MEMNTPEKEQYTLMEIDGKTVLFTDSRIDRAAVPEDICRYDVRDSDYLDGSIAEIAPFVLVNRLGTVLSREPFPLDEHGSYFPLDWNYLSEDVTLDEYLHLTSEQFQTEAGVLGEELQLGL